MISLGGIFCTTLTLLSILQVGQALQDVQLRRLWHLRRHQGQGQERQVRLHRRPKVQEGRRGGEEVRKEEEEHVGIEEEEEEKEKRVFL